MTEKQTRSFLIRNMPIEVYNQLEKAAQEHHRSKNQEAIVILTHAFSGERSHVKKPVPFEWKKKISNKFIEDTINEGRE